MKLIAQQIRSSLRRSAEWPEGTAGEDLACAVCLHLALVPEVRQAKVDEVRARLRVSGPPSPALLADLLVEAMVRPEPVDVRLLTGSSLTCAS